MVFAVALAGLLEPLLAPRGRHYLVEMKMGRPRKNLQDEAPGEGRRRRLTGSFVEPDYADPLDKKPPRSGMGAARWWVRPAQPNADDPSDERDTEPMPDFRQPEPWSSRSMLARSRWKDPEYKERVLAKRRATRAANGNTPVATARPTYPHQFTGTGEGEEVAIPNGGVARATSCAHWAPVDAPLTGEVWAQPPAPLAGGGNAKPLRSSSEL